MTIYLHPKQKHYQHRLMLERVISKCNHIIPSHLDNQCSKLHYMKTLAHPWWKWDISDSKDILVTIQTSCIVQAIWCIHFMLLFIYCNIWRPSNWLVKQIFHMGPSIHIPEIPGKIHQPYISKALSSIADENELSVPQLRKRQTKQCISWPVSKATCCLCQTIGMQAGGEYSSAYSI